LVEREPGPFYLEATSAFESFSFNSPGGPFATTFFFSDEARQSPYLFFFLSSFLPHLPVVFE